MVDTNILEKNAVSIFRELQPVFTIVITPYIILWYNVYVMWLFVSWMPC
jgi:hypothetical protein